MSEILRKIFSREFIPFWLLALAAVTLSAVLSPLSFNSKITNLKIPTTTSVKESYIMTSKSDSGKCYLVDRRDSTIRRSGTNIPGDSWELNLVPGSANPKNPDSILLISKKKGTIFFVPPSKISNPAYPYSSEFVRKKLKDPDIPKLQWNQVYINRIYSGLYLKVELPSDPTKKKGRKGSRRELLSVKGNHLTLVNTLFNPDSRFLAEVLLSGVFPKATPCNPAIAWLDTISQTERTTFIIGNTEPYNVSIVPMPVTIDEVYEKHFGKSLKPALDERFGEWHQAATGGAQDPGFSEEEAAGFRAGYENYMKDFGAALDAHRSVFGTADNIQSKSAESLPGNGE